MVAFDVVEDILLRSDAKDLLRCKSVCKSWYSLISTPRFVKDHLKRACSSTNNDSSSSSKVIGHTRIATSTYWKKIVKLPNESLYQVNLWKVVGSSNGLVCVSRLLHDGLMLVTNPLTREVRTLPMPPIPPKNALMSLSLSFGYDASSDDYKVVMGIKEKPSGTLFQVFSLKSNTWKIMGRFNYTLWYNRSGMLVNGSFYWIAFESNQSLRFDFDNYERKKLILSFDLYREDFTVVPHPNDSRYSSNRVSLGITENQLCLYFQDLSHHHIWVIRSDNVEQSWEYLPNDCDRTYEAVHFLSMVEFTSPDQNQHQTRISFFCADNKCLPRPWEKYTTAHTYMSSLVSPHLVSPHVSSGHPTKFDKPWSIEVAKAECPHTKAEITKFFKASEKIEEAYRLEVGEAENFYLHEDGKERLKKENGEAGKTNNNIPNPAGAVKENKEIVMFSII